MWIEPEQVETRPAIVKHIVDEPVKSLKTLCSVIPAKAGFQYLQAVTNCLDSGFRRSDDLLRYRHCCYGRTMRPSRRGGVAARGAGTARRNGPQPALPALS
jgi:hypothetical protein